MPVGRPLRRGPRVAAAGQRDAGIGQRGPGQLGLGRGVLGSLACLLDRGGRHDARSRAHPPPGGGEAVAVGRHHDEVVTGEREVDGLLPAVDPHGPAHQGVEHRLRHVAAPASPHVGPDRLGAAAGGQVPDPGGRRPVRVSEGPAPHR